LIYNFFLLQSHPGGLLFTKFGSNQTALLDLAFPVMTNILLTSITYVWKRGTGIADLCLYFCVLLCTCDLIILSLSFLRK